MTGKQATYHDTKVIILRVTAKEVLILQGKNTRWISKEMFNLASSVKV